MRWRTECLLLQQLQRLHPDSSRARIRGDAFVFVSMRIDLSVYRVKPGAQGEAVQRA